jgi:proteasome alpha subunit
MLDEPYRWVEAVRNRREYLEDQLAGASPVVGLAYADGLLLLTTTPGPRKLFEAYNQIAYAAIGHPADIEKLRKAVIDVAHVEGFNHSARDVSLHRLVNYGLGPLMKGAFDEIYRSPFTARVLVAELDAADPEQSFYSVDADGSFANGPCAAVGGTPEAEDAARLHLAGGEADMPLDQALDLGLRAWGIGRMVAAEAEANTADGAVGDFLKKELAGLRVEAAVLDRNPPQRSKFRLLDAEQLGSALKPYIG